MSKPIPHLLYVPEAPDRTEPCPLVIFLHGAGERGSNLNQVKVHVPPKLVEAGDALPFILVSPQAAQTVFGISTN